MIRQEVNPTTNPPSSCWCRSGTDIFRLPKLTSLNLYSHGPLSAWSITKDAAADAKENPSQ